MGEGVVAADAETGGIGVVDDAEDVTGLAGLVGVGDGLGGRGGDREQQIVAAGDHLLGHRERDGHVAAGIVAAQFEIPAVDPAAVGEAGDDAVAALVEGGLGGVLEEGDAELARG